MIVSDFRALLTGNDAYRWNGMTTKAAPVFVTFNFADASELPSIGDYDPHGAAGYQAMDAAQRQNMREAMAEYERVTGVKFIEVDSGGMIEMFGAHGGSGTSWANYPGTTENWTNEGRLVMHDRHGPMDQGTEGFQIALHELGHAMGLEHTHDGDVTLNPAIDNTHTSVMSYNWVSPAVSTLRTMDIQALNHLYGGSYNPAAAGISYHWNEAIDRFTISGGAGNDVLIGVNFVNHIYGGAGNDMIFGRSSDDVLNGGAGNDVMGGGDGDDTIYGASGNDVLGGGYGNDALYGGAGNDRLVASQGADHFDGGSGTDTIDASSLTWAQYIYLTDDAYVSVENILGSAQNDWLFGNGGSNTITGGAGADNIDGGAGYDWAYYVSSYAVTVRLWAGDGSGGEAQGDTLANIENLAGSAYADTLIGASGVANVLFGGGGNDYLAGLSGDDTLIGGPGADIMDGGAGRDSVSYSQSLASVTVRLWNGTGLGGDAQSDQLSSIEDLSGSAYGDTLIGANGVANVLLGNGGNDYLNGLSGNDTLNGGAGGDTLDGGAGSDWVQYTGSVAVTVRLWNGTGLGGEAQGDRLASIENIAGSAFGDALVGSNNTDNALWGGGGNDFLAGLSGNDVLIGGSGADTLDGGAGRDSASYSQSPTGVTVRLWNGTGAGGDAHGDVLTSVENILGSQYADALIGSDATANTLQGGGGNDFLAGLLGNDILVGGAGQDILLGGGGIDTLSGGADADVFDFDALSDSLFSARDHITDFVSGLDLIDLTGVDARSDMGGDQAFSYIGAAVFSGLAGQLRFQQASGYTFLLGDIDGDGSADFGITLSGTLTLSEGDFLL